MSYLNIPEPQIYAPAPAHPPAGFHGPGQQFSPHQGTYSYSPSPTPSPSSYMTPYPPSPMPPSPVPPSPMPSDTAPLYPNDAEFGSYSTGPLATTFSPGSTQSRAIHTLPTATPGHGHRPTQPSAAHANGPHSRPADSHQCSCCIIM
ncbi:hypothetical protein PsYK624_138620 [Phanerochaete sordida]|uniref:Uncharacterized protein n=1 Tax=Phanerochaete sordida TaxID=48140 RepID=A0A9P3GMB7_9APHY|nr:hypothetical protein PsYK624_138620 [Phanerochaete sordida]